MLAAVIDGSDLDETDAIRKNRALAEYGDFASRKLTSSQVRSAADVAERIVNAIRRSACVGAPTRQLISRGPRFGISVRRGRHASGEQVDHEVSQRSIRAPRPVVVHQRAAPASSMLRWVCGRR